MSGVEQQDREAAILLVEIIQDSGFDWSVNLTRLVDGVSEYTLTYHGEVSIHPDTSEAYARLHQLQAEEKAAAALDFIQTIRHEARKAALEEIADAVEGKGGVIPLASAFVPLIVGHNQPCMSGDMRDQLNPHKRRQFDDAMRDFATAIRSAVGGENPSA